MVLNGGNMKKDVRCRSPPGQTATSVVEQDCAR